MTKLTVEIKREGRVWAWFVMDGCEMVKAGYAATKADALNDGRIAAGMHSVPKGWAEIEGGAK